MTTDPLDGAYAAARRLLGEYLELPLPHRAAWIANLRPRPEDHARVFVPEPVAQAARDGYRALWGNAPVWPVPDRATLEVFCATAEALATATGSEAFPGGYREIACWLRKDTIWVAWTIGDQRRADRHLFDGLVEVEPGRWAWFPRPWKVLPRAPAPQIWWED